MVDIPDIDLAGRDPGSCRLRVASQAKVRISLGEQLGIDGPVRLMAGGAAIAKSCVLENKRPRLLTVTRGADLMEARHRESTRGFEDVGSVRVVGLRACQFPLKERMMLGQMKLRFRRPVTLETSRWVFAWVDDEFAASAAAGHVQAACAVAGFAAGLPRRARVV